MRVLLCGIACLGVGGCSFIWGATGAYDIPSTQPSDSSCEHWVPPLLDSIAVAVFAPALIGPGAIVAIIPVGAVYFFSARYGWGRFRACRDAPHERELVAARTLTTQARSAGSANDCVTVAALDARVCEIDPTYHAHEFMADPVIARCAGEQDAAQRCARDTARRKHEACVSERQRIYELMKASDDHAERLRLLAQAPRCDAIAPVEAVPRPER